MKISILFFFLAVCFSAGAQVNDLDNYQQDTIVLRDVSLSKAVGFDVGSAIILIDYDFFKRKLHDERKGNKRAINSRKRVKNDIAQSQMRYYQRQFPVLDSVYKSLTKTSMNDTAWVNYEIFREVNSAFGDFIPLLIETRQCVILDKNKVRQPFIIRQTGSKRTGTWTGVGNRLYFIPGTKHHFWSKMNWVS